MPAEDKNSELREYWIQNFPTWCDDESIHQENNIVLKYWWASNGYRFRLGAHDFLYVDLIEDPDSFIRLELEDLKSKFFSDIYNPTDNELVFFELTYGFEWPFCGCAVGIEDSPSAKRTTQEKNKKDNKHDVNSRTT